MITQSTASSCLLRLRGLAVAAGSRPLLSDLDLTLAPGERVALSGPSGSGKTTLLRTITGLIDPAAGTVELNGSCPDELRWPCFRRRTVLVEQRPVLLAGSVRDNLARPFSYRSATSAFPAARAEELLTRLGLSEDVLAQEATSLSQGEQQRICLVRAVLLEPQVMLLDEPTSALDEGATAAVEALVSTETETRGAAALIVTHNRDQSHRWCHRIHDLAAHRVEVRSP